MRASRPYAPGGPHSAALCYSPLQLRPKTGGMPMQKLWRFLFLLSFFALPIAAQTTTIRGRVTLPEGDALPGVTVTADDFGVTAVTDADGRYVLSIPSDRVKGPLKITASLAGFQTRSDIVNATGGAATANFTLRVSFGEQI